MKIHIPTEQYGFIEAEVETVEEAFELSESVKSTFKQIYSTGLNAKEFNQALDRYVSEGTGETETYIAMSDEQKRVIQELKKSFKRLESKNGA